MAEQRFGPFELEDELGRGATGVVYRARDGRHDGRRVAVRIIDPARSAEPAFRARFRRHAAAVAALHAPHVVPVHSAGEIEGRLFVDMRLIEAPDLSAVLARGPLPAPVRERIAAQLHATWAELHRAGLPVHQPDHADVLLTGPPEHPFVQLVGLGLGRPDDDPRPRPDAERLLTPDPGVTRRRVRRRAALGLGVLAALGGTVAAVAATRPSTPVPDGIMEAIDGPPTAVRGGVVDGVATLLTVDGDGAVRLRDVTGRPSGPPVAEGALLAELVGADDRTIVAVLREDLTIQCVDPGGAELGPPIRTDWADTALTRTSVDEGGISLAGLDDGAEPQILVRLPVSGLDGEGPVRRGVQAFRVPGGAAVGPMITAERERPLGAQLLAWSGRSLTLRLDGASVTPVDLGTGEPAAAAAFRAPSPMRRLAVARDDRVVVATVDGELRVWTVGGDPVGRPIGRVPGLVDGLGTVIVGGTEVVACVATAFGTGRRSVTFLDLDGARSPVDLPADHPLLTSVPGFVDAGPVGILTGLLPGGDRTIWEVSRVVTL